MKKLTIIALLILAGLFGNTKISAQNDDLYSYMDQYLSSEEKDQISRAKTTYEKGTKLESQIKEEDGKTDKYFQKNAKKGEKKSVEVKTLRIKQAMFYEQAYVQIYNLYSEKVGEGVFVFEEDEAKVNNLLEEATNDNASAKKKFKDYKNVTPKDLKKNISYSKLKSDIEGMQNLYESSIKKLIEAYTVIVDQEQKKQLQEEENRSWQNAQSENTVYSYRSYLNDYPNGKYVKEANSLLADLEAQEKKKLADQKSRDMSNVVFKVQIAASKTKLADYKVKNIYKVGALKDITVTKDDEWYRYSVGNFTKYEDAKAFVAKSKVKGAFVVVYRSGKKIPITDVVEKK